MPLAANAWRGDKCKDHNVLAPNKVDNHTSTPSKASSTSVPQGHGFANNKTEDTEPVEVTFVDARVPMKLISMRFDNETIEALKSVARRKGIGYQTLIRLWVNERLAQEQTGCSA